MLSTCCCSGQWPPRSYTCSFCRREFCTAQALGGHMNVHRLKCAEANEVALHLHLRHHQTLAPAPPPCRSRLEAAAASVPSEHENLDLELRLGTSDSFPYATD
ncbi:protein MpSUP [Marchantia polymorpha subsp. ruderalis]|uniref:C2H2-type domain-containing protein n=2 Tax=Marchantia polymorpha TaxID=3197 RepID=A0AAF6AU36_MARPO|nr:hypothetical protein MARPO_0061s0011 [Marchantia polymorpha]BBM99956.1 hypothetical protein Mp_1g25140 [Marchantia polymorpha subsp. ruderalis]|eukprot:PTQ36730.1 hypothetical protein MARPO_0061s0011 [Marchantia polymorpha]